jgi:hypothetical protein
LYITLGAGFGGDVTGSAEAGSSPSRAAFSGSGNRGCAGVLGAGACASSNQNGTTLSGSVGVGSRSLPIPVSSHVERTYTFTVTATELSASVRNTYNAAANAVNQFKREAVWAMNPANWK